VPVSIAKAHSAHIYSGNLEKGIYIFLEYIIYRFVVFRQLHHCWNDCKMKQLCRSAVTSPEKDSRLSIRRLILQLQVQGLLVCLNQSNYL